MIAHAETAVDDWKSSNEWVEYEMRLNCVLPRYDHVICTYDVNLLTAPLAVDILRAHPVVVIGGSLVETPSSRGGVTSFARCKLASGRRNPIEASFGTWAPTCHRRQSG